MRGDFHRVRIDRLVLDGADLDAHDLARLPRLVGAALADSAEPGGARSMDEAGPPEVGDVHAIAGEIAGRTRAAIAEQGGRR